ncbi:MAG: phenylacetate--CoA ligase family protein [Burkholderiaceae bacterium]|nr:phenylacetate--CoA ligase family protein [Burkholderiaceae bacterium]
MTFAMHTDHCAGAARPDGARIASSAREMLDRERWPRKRLLEHQRNRLRELLRHAAAHSPHYRHLLGASHDGDVSLQELPVLTKATLMAQFELIVTDPRLRLAELERHLTGHRAAEPFGGAFRVVGSGGTSGQRSVAVYDVAAWETAVAGVLRAMEIADIAAPTRLIGIGAPTPLHLSNRLLAELRAGRSDMPVLSVTTPIDEIVRTLNAWRPEAVVTYPSLIRRLAEEQREDRLRIAPRTFCSVAETMTPDLRSLAHDTWGALVLNGYASTETGVMAQECPCGGGLHVFEDLLIVEVVDAQNRPVAPGVVGHKVLVTNLFNQALPLIRYELPDLAALAQVPCACGRSLWQLASIEGRREEVLRLPARSGGSIDVHAFLLGETLLHLPAVHQYQLAPRPHGLLARVVLRDASVAAQTLSAARQAIAAELERLGACVATVEVEAVDHIARTGSGAKQRLVGAQ